MPKKLTEKDKLIDQHYDLSMRIALQAVRINEMQKQLSKLSDELLAVEGKIEMLEAEQNGKGLN